MIEINKLQIISKDILINYVKEQSFKSSYDVLEVM